MILHNGPIYTMDPRLPQVSALAVADDLIAGGVDVREGEVDTVGHERLDLDGRCVLPGFTDSHAHFLEWALERGRLELTHCASRAEALAAIGAAAPGDGWLLGHGWLSARWPDGEPTAAALDEVTGERPAALWAHDHHTLWVNSAAMQATGVRSDDGVFAEWDSWRFPLPKPTAAERSRAVVDGMAAANARGVVCVHDFQRSGGRDVWQRLDADRRLRLRVVMSFPLDMLAAARDLELRAGFGSRMLAVGPCKAFMDGTLGSRTAWMLDGSGDRLLSSDELAEGVREASAMGVPVAVHAIGDGANRAALDAFERTRDVWEAAALRPRIEHAQCVHPDDVPRFARLGVAASVQYTHATSDRDVADRLWGDRAAHAYPYASLLAAGALLAGGSDAPVEELDPLAGLRAAVLRTDGDRPPWRPEQAIGLGAALASFTTGPAWLAGEEHVRGRIAPGLLADLVVLDRDPVAGLEDARVAGTMLAGEWTLTPPGSA